MQNKHTKQQEQMTPVGLKEFRKTDCIYQSFMKQKESFINKTNIKSQKKKNKEKAKAMLKLTKRENPYKTRRSFSKFQNRVRNELPSSPQKQAAIVEGLAGEFGYKVRPSRNNTEDFKS